ncbi:hypothetical protein AAMO2058_000669400 [Amorphochlora amoebiformis]
MSASSLPPRSRKRKSYYEIINGVKYDRGMIQAALKHRINKEDGKKDLIRVKGAKAIISEALDGGKYTSTEKKTMEYLRNRFCFSKKAKVHMDHQLQKFAGKGRTAEEIISKLEGTIVDIEASFEKFRKTVKSAKADVEYTVKQSQALLDQLRKTLGVKVRK